MLILPEPLVSQENEVVGMVQAYKSGMGMSQQDSNPKS
ncbi:hypothetical protein CHY_1330 [Carboxydothermus hydrogenoformans Z-2901]|uniref:Uncharacterized protein n=1 Tax=Carboxydothermus hydrogenoformans (strain ATCC BAA-161 / DSM 6008 / Z-2901) TaxID=246194 RepID=Q3ACG9_CARHZ|nr:hypothetical protein CHY_1330 [Carboxydothermus hydrogenoformans Z-2901]